MKKDKLTKKDKVFASIGFLFFGVPLSIIFLFAIAWGIGSYSSVTEALTEMFLGLFWIVFIILFLFSLFKLLNKYIKNK